MQKSTQIISSLNFHSVNTPVQTVLQSRKPFLSPSGYWSSPSRGIIIPTSVALPVFELYKTGIKLYVFLCVCILSFKIFVIFIHATQLIIAV